jgi:hypothetical protein
MNRIRSVTYYSRDQVPKSWLMAALIGRFLPGELVGIPALEPEEIRRALMEQCLTMLDAGNGGIRGDKVITAIIQRSFCGLDPEEQHRICDAGVKAIDRVAHRIDEHVQKYGPFPQILPLWSIGNSLMPFTQTCLPFIVRVRKCWCGCWVQDVETNCPFCGGPAPGGPTRRAWVRGQFHVGQWAPQMGAAIPGTPMAPPEAAGIWKDAIEFVYRVSNNADRLGDQSLEPGSEEIIDHDQDDPEEEGKQK